MCAAAAVQAIFSALLLPFPIRIVGVFLPPLFAALTALATYALASQLHSRTAGMLASAFVAVAPGYLAQSVAGVFESECIAIFLLVVTYYFWLRALECGSVWWATLSALSFACMAATWGGYVFVINLVPLHVLALLLLGRFTSRAYVTFSTFVVLSTLFAMQVPSVGFSAVQSSAHMLALSVFVVVQLRACMRGSFCAIVHEARCTRMCVLVASLVTVAVTAFVVVFGRGYGGVLMPWNDRLASLLDPSSFKDVPIIASVTEHQPPTAVLFNVHIHVLLFFVPPGLWVIINGLHANDGAVFALLFATTSLYFSGVMERLLVVFVPAAAVVAGIGVAALLDRWLSHVNRNWLARVVVLGLLLMTSDYVVHCTWVARMLLSSPATVLSGKRSDGSVRVYDEYREAYRWLNQNTDVDSRIMAWWDYGFELQALANRTVLVDNNTRNHTQIALVGQAFASDEAVAHRFALRYDVDFVVVRFGGLVGHAVDDIGKFRWMIKFAGLVDPTMTESSFWAFSSGGGEPRFSVGADASHRLLDSLLYKLCYYRFGNIATSLERSAGFDNARRQVIGDRRVALYLFEEVYSTESWLVRVYRVKRLNFV